MNKSAEWWGQGSGILQRDRQGSVCLGEVCQLRCRSARVTDPKLASRNGAVAESCLTSMCSEAAGLN